MTTPRRPPILEHPGTGPAIIEPSRFLAGRPRLPERAVLCFFHDVLDTLHRSGELTLETRLTGEGPPIEILRHEAPQAPPVAIAFPGIGAPFATTTLEELIGLGARVFVCIGGAGVLDGEIPVGRLLLPTSALRDEGTSYHYQRRGRFSRPDRSVVRALRAACEAEGHAPLTVATWTTDAPFRETPGQIAQRRATGCRAVEMEAAALFAVARFRQIALAQLLYAGDDVSGDRWKHRDWIAQGETREAMVRIALDAVRRIAL